MGGCSRSLQACAPGHPSQWVSAWGWVGRDPTRLSGSSSPTRHPHRHQWQTQAGSCSAENFIKCGLGMRIKVPMARALGRRTHVRRRHLQATDARSLAHQPGRHLCLPCQPCPGASSASGTGLSGWQAAGTRGRASRSVPSPQPSLHPISCRKLHLCSFPERAGSPLADTTSGQRAGAEGDCPVPTTSPIFVTFS